MLHLKYHVQTKLCQRHPTDPLTALINSILAIWAVYKLQSALSAVVFAVIAVHMLARYFSHKFQEMSLDQWKLILTVYCSLIVVGTGGLLRIS